MLELLFIFLSVFTYAEEEGLPEGVIRKDHAGAYYYGTDKKDKKKKTIKGVQQPYKVDSDGVYYYGDESSQKAKAIDGVEQPIDKDSSGGYYYSRKKKPKKPKNTYGEQPSRVNADGSYFYDAEEQEANNNFALRFGMFAPPQLKAGNDTTYEDVYGNNSSFILALEYDWKLSSNLYVKFSSGFTSAQGSGRFANGNASGSAPRETFQFFVFPNTFTGVYKIPISDYITPYIEAGPGYFTFIESRSDGSIFEFDGEKTKFGGALVAAAAGGLLISITKFSSGNTFLSDYGASQAWVDLQFKQIFGLDSRKDFTSNIITGGIAIGF